MAPQPVDPTQDPVNIYVKATTVIGLIVSFRIDGTKISLEHAQPARIPKPRAGRAGKAATATITAFAGTQPVARSIVADPIYNIVEGVGVVRMDKRQLIATVETPSAIDAIEVRLSVNGASAKFDVTGAYAEICRALPDDPVCRRGASRN
jgi:hypothetical protein